MNILYFQEEREYSKNDLCVCIDSIDPLLEKGVLIEKKSKSRQKGDKEKTVAFAYVGFLFDNQHDQVRIIAVLPKYLNIETMDLPEKTKSAALLIQLFSKYAKASVKNDRWDKLDFLSENSQFNIFSVAEYLLRDYLEHGLYHKETETWEINGNSLIDWEKTITTEHALVSNGQVIYPNLYTYTKEADENNEVRHIHHYCIYQAAAILTELEIFQISSFSVPFVPMPKLSLFSHSQQINLLNRELQNIFSDREIHLLKTLIYFMENQGKTVTGDIILYGTKKFHTLWEAVISEVFNDEYKLYKNMIPKPKWIHSSTAKENETETLIPDTLRLIGKNFYIVDSKYYKLPFDKTGKIINNIPGIGDTGKQYLYAKIFQQALTDKKIHNCFLFPVDDDSVQHLGNVEFALFPELPDIQLIALPATRFFEYYIDGHTLTDNEIEQILNRTAKRKRNLELVDTIVGNDSFLHEKNKIFEFAQNSDLSPDNKSDMVFFSALEHSLQIWDRFRLHYSLKDILNHEKCIEIKKFLFRYKYNIEKETFRFLLSSAVTIYYYYRFHQNKKDDKFDFTLPTSGIWKSIEVELNASILHYLRFVLNVSTHASHRDPTDNIFAHIIIKTSCGNSVCLTDKKGKAPDSQLNSLMLGPIQHIVHNVAYPKTDKGNTLALFERLFDSNENKKQETKNNFKKLEKFIEEVSKKRNPNTHEKLMSEDEFTELVNYVFNNEEFSFYNLMELKNNLKTYIKETFPTT